MKSYITYIKENLTDYKIVRLEPEDIESYIDDLLEIEEECFPDLAENEDSLREIITEMNVILFGAYHDDKLIGSLYYNKLESLTSSFFKDEWDPKTYKHFGENNTYYLNSMGILKEYRGIDIMINLKIQAMNYLRNMGVKYEIGHTYQRLISLLTTRLKAKILQKFENWIDTGITHLLYEIEL